MVARDQLTYEPCPLPPRAEMTDAGMQAAAAAHFEAMKTRRSVRQFSTRPVPRAVIAECIRTAGRAPSGANHQPWHFVAVAEQGLKAQIRTAAEEEERRFYDGAAGDEWLRALEPIGTGWQKPHLETAPWLIVVFAQRWGRFDDGTRYKNYHVPESTGIACGFLVTALHLAGLSSLVHTPNPMKFLTPLLGRPEEEKPVMILAVGHAAPDATVPAAAGIKKPLDEILTVRE